MASAEKIRKPPRRLGTTFSPELGAKICERIAGGESLRTILGDPGMPAMASVLSWALGGCEGARAAGFPEQYVRARELRSELYADEIIDLADDKKEDPQRSRLQIDARKWVASKLLPKTYGEKVAHEHSGPDGGPIETKDATVDLRKLSTGTLRQVLTELGSESPAES